MPKGRKAKNPSFEGDRIWLQGDRIPVTPVTPIVTHFSAKVTGVEIAALQGFLQFPVTPVTFTLKYY
jgi:hypothetical protein